jgi:hypothetical protein
MGLTAGEPPSQGEGEGGETNPPFKYEEQKHTGQAYPQPTADDRHPWTINELLDRLEN